MDVEALNAEPRSAQESVWSQGQPRGVAVSIFILTGPTRAAGVVDYPKKPPIDYASFLDEATDTLMRGGASRGSAQHFEPAQ